MAGLNAYDVPVATHTDDGIRVSHVTIVAADEIEAGYQAMTNIQTFLGSDDLCAVELDDISLIVEGVSAR